MAFPSRSSQSVGLLILIGFGAGHSCAHTANGSPDETTQVAFPPEILGK